MYICDQCASILRGEIKPACFHFPPNEIPWEKGICPLCNKEDNLSLHPEIINIQNENNTD